METNHPCLCDKCLSARDSELKRLRYFLLDELLSDIGEDIKQDEIDDDFIDGLTARANQKIGINQERSRVRAIINNKKLK